MTVSLPRRLPARAAIAALALSGLAAVAAPSAQAAAPANDDRFTAVAVTPDGTTYDVDNTDATAGADADLPQAQCSGAANNSTKSVWYKFASTSASTVTAESWGRDTILRVFQAPTPSPASLSYVGCNDDITVVPANGTGNWGSRVTFTTSTATTYFFQVVTFSDTVGSLSGPGVLTFRLGAAASTPANDNIAGIATLAGSDHGTVPANTGMATSEATDPANVATDPPQSTIWFSWTAPRSGTVRWSTSAPSPARPDTSISVFPATGATTTATALASNDDRSPGSVQSRVALAATSGVTYRILVGAKRNLNGSATLAWSMGPANDDLVDAVALTEGVTAHATTLDATFENGENTDCDEFFGLAHSVWYSWTAPAGKRLVTVQTSGGAADYDSVLGVFTTSGPAPGFPLTNVACDDEGGDVHLSKAQFRSEGATTYYIQLSNLATQFGTDPGPGPVDLTLTTEVPPANDDLADATAVTGPSGTSSGTTLAAGSQPQEPFSGDHAGRTVWFRWEAPISRSVAFETTGDNPLRDTTMDVFTGTTLANLVSVAANDDLDASGQVYLSRVSFDAVAGTTYLVRVDDTNSSAGIEGAVGTGPFGLSWDLAAPTATTTLLNASASGSTVSLTASVAPAVAETVTGTVEFFEGSVSRGTAPVSGGVASTQLTGVAPGTHTYTAVFTSGSPLSVAGSTSSPDSVSITAPPVVKLASRTTVKAPRTARTGQRPSVTITVKRGTANAAGKVTVKVNGKLLKVATLKSGKVVVRLAKLTRAGKVTVAVTYAGNATTKPSSGKAVITVKKPKKG